jgi:CubicO group peptidase (beta-lactamase class C family)
MAMASAALGNRADGLLKAAALTGKPRAAVLMVRDGGESYVAAYGEAKKDSRFLLASITKPMSAAGVMWLVERGKIGLDDRAQKYLPELNGAITVRQLLTHTSGLPDMLPDNTLLRQRHAPLAEYTRLGLKTPLLFAPGEKWSYSSTGILLATEIAQRVDGRPIAKLLAEEIYRPLGMKHTTLGIDQLDWGRVVRSQTEYAPSDLGATADATQWDWNSAYWRGLGSPWGGAHAPAEDVMRFVMAFMAKDAPVLRPETRKMMITNQNRAGLTPYGIGWALGARLGKGLSEAAYGHGGSTGTLAWAEPERGRAMVLLTSLPDVVARKLVIQPVSEAIATGA